MMFAIIDTDRKAEPMPPENEEDATPPHPHRYNRRPSEEMPGTDRVERARREERMALQIDHMHSAVERIEKRQSDIAEAHRVQGQQLTELRVEVSEMGKTLDNHLAAHRTEETAAKNRWRNVMPTLLASALAAVAAAAIIAAAV
jgi:hypothetical protein